MAGKFGCKVFWQAGGEAGPNFIGGQPQLCFGGRSIFWSRLIPAIQPWELDFFPAAVRDALTGGLLAEAGYLMNESRTLGPVAQAIVSKLRQSPLAQDFSIQETPRALHQPYLARDGAPKGFCFVEPTGVFNTAELLLNQAGLSPGRYHGDGVELADSSLSNFGDVRYEGLNRVLDEAVSRMGNEASTLDQISGLVGSGTKAEWVNRAVQKVTGYDGVVAEGFGNQGIGGGRLYIVFFPE